jgi:hypothetical protein
MRHGEITAILELSRRLPEAGEGSDRLWRESEQRRALWLRLIGEQRSQQLSGDPEGDIVLELRARSAQHAQATPAGLIECCLEQPGLAKPGVPFEQQRSASAVGGLSDRSIDCLQRVGALE